jgi:hypothetical protein
MLRSHLCLNHRTGVFHTGFRRKLCMCFFIASCTVTCTAIATSFILWRVKWLYIGFGLVIGFIAHLQLGITSNYNAAQIIIVHTSLLSMLQPTVVVAWPQSSNKGYSSHPYGSRTALPNHRLKDSDFRDHALQITVTHRLVFSVMVFIALLGNVFHQWTWDSALPRNDLQQWGLLRFSRLLQATCLSLELPAFELDFDSTLDWRSKVSQSQSYFTTGGLPPVSSSWRQAPWDSRPEIF